MATSVHMHSQTQVRYRDILTLVWVLVCLFVFVAFVRSAPPEVVKEIAAPQDKVRQIVVKVPEGKSLAYRAVGDKVALAEMKGTAKGESLFWLISETGGRSHVVWWFAGESDSSVTDVNVGSVPPNPNPGPLPDPAPVKVDSVWVIVVEKVGDVRTIDTAKFLNDPYWQTLTPKNEFRHYISNSPTAIEYGYSDKAESVGYPAVLIIDHATAKVLRSFKQSGASTDVLKSEVSKWVK